MDAETELKPCRCGDTAILEIGRPSLYHVLCTNCNARTGDGQMDEVIAAWNTRPTVEAPAGVVERVIDVLRDELCSTDHPVSDWERETAQKIVAALSRPQGEPGELVERLRAKAKYTDRVFDNSSLGELYLEAADALTAKDAEIEALREQVRGLTPRAAAWDAAGAAAAAQIIVGLFDAQTPEQKKARPAAIDKAVREFRALLEAEAGK